MEITNYFNIVKQNEVTEYFASTDISQSKLKTLLLSPQLFKKETKNDLYFEEKEHFIIGAAVDFLFTFDGDMDFFTENYYISHIEDKPTDVVKSIIHSVFDKINEILQPFESFKYFNEYKDLILEACIEHEYYKNLKDDTRVNKILENSNDFYFQELMLSKNKIILSKEDVKTILSIYVSITKNEYTNKYFDKEIYGIINQLPIYFDIDGVKCKALLDRVCIDHINKTIQIIDFKTTGDYTLNFHKQLKKFRYDIQAAYYTTAMMKNIKNSDLADYKILPFIFIVESTLQQGFPIIYTISESLLDTGKNGQNQAVVSTFDRTAFVSHEVLGYKQLFDLHKYYEENGYDMPKIIKENNHNLTLDWFGIE